MQRRGYYLTVGRLPPDHAAHPGRLLAICSDGSPQFGHTDIAVLSVEVVDSVREAKIWFKWVKRTKPWMEVANER